MTTPAQAAGTALDRTPPPPIEDPGSSVREMTEAWLRHLWRRLNQGRDTGEWPPPWAPPAAAIAALAVLVALIVLVIIPLAVTVFTVTVDALRGGAGWLRDWPVTALVLDPVHRYLDSHAAGLPIDTATLQWTWAAAGVGTLLLGWMVRAVAARIGWVLYGAATAAMVWAATPGPSRTVAVGLTVLAWTVLSLFALRRRWGRPRIVVAQPDLDDLTRLLSRRLPR